MREFFAHSAPSKRGEKTNVPAHRLLLSAILALSAFLNLSWLTSEEYANVYYAASVKNMLISSHNFFFASYDAGFVSVDKPPLGFWIQAASAHLFGFDGWSLLLPQALAGVLCVALLYHLVARGFGAVAGLLAALALALSPISVAISRHNNLEGLLVLAVLVAAWAFMLAAESGRLRWLVVGALLIGLGFNIKMLEAFVVLPAFYLLYLVAAPVGLRRRVIHLGLATVVIIAASLPWVVAVDLTPAEQRPYVGSSSFNTVTDLIVGWNGVGRIVGSDEGVGDPGPLRLLNPQLGSQIGWLLALAVVGLAAASWQRIQGRPSLPLSRKQSGHRAVGYLADHAGDVLQRRRRLGPPLSGHASPGGRSAGGSGGGDTVGGIPEAGLAWVAVAPDAPSNSQLTDTYTRPLPGLEPLVGAHDCYPLNLAAAVSFVVARLTPRLKDSGLPLALVAIRVGVVFPLPRPFDLGRLYGMVRCRNPIADRWSSGRGQRVVQQVW